MGSCMDDKAELMLSDQVGEGANSMSTLIQKHMTSILSPVAERVLDLEDTCKTQAAEIKDLQDRLERAHGRLDQHDGNLGSLATGLDRTREDLKLAHESIGEADQRHAALESEHDATRTLARAIDTSHKSTSASLGDAHRAIEDLDSRARQLQAALSETNVAHMNINDRMTEMRNRQEGHNDRHLDLVKIVQELRTSDENSKQAMRRFTATFDKQRRDAERSFAQFEDRSRNAEASIVELQHSIDGTVKAQKNQKNDLAQIRGLLDNYVGAQQHSQKGRESAAPARDLQGRVAKVEEAVANLAKAQSQDKSQTAAIVQTISEALVKNGEDIGKQSQDLEGIEKRLKNQEHRLNKTEQKTGELGTRQDRLKENIEKCDTDLRTLLNGMQREVTAKMDNQWHELSKTNANVSQAGQRLDATNTTMHNIASELTNTGHLVNKIEASLGLAHEYFQGLTKGFQDTNKRVASGQDGMLPPKSTGGLGGGGVGPHRNSFSKTLPVIPQTPRP